MRKRFLALSLPTLALTLVFYQPFALAAAKRPKAVKEHAGKEHAGQEHGGTALAVKEHAGQEHAGQPLAPV